MNAFTIVFAKVCTFYYSKCIEFQFNKIQSARVHWRFFPCGSENIKQVMNARLATRCYSELFLLENIVLMRRLIEIMRQIWNPNAKEKLANMEEKWKCFAFHVALDCGTDKAQRKVCVKKN